MAKSKSSQQVDLSANSKTGINITSDLGFASRPVNHSNLGQEDPKAEDLRVDRSVDSNTNKPDNTDIMSHSQIPDIGEAKKSTDTTSKPASKGKSKLKRPDEPGKEDNICKISANISEEAKRNLEKYAKLYGYKKLSPFLNDLLERLDLYMD